MLRVWRRKGGWLVRIDDLEVTEDGGDSVTVEFTE